MIIGTEKTILGVIAVADEVRETSKNCDSKTSSVRYQANNYAGQVIIKVLQMQSVHM
ncbi:cadmium translocating P-type ATPase CadA, putative [Staphylococcus aureus]|nr:cadmium translocating P-type ATPase CadA, putative [Staphylococcus aureus]